MSILVRWWNGLLISKKLTLVVGVMAVLIAGELLTLRFAMETLSAARAFVGGESLYSKGQKNAVLALERYSETHDEKDFDAFLENLKVPASDRRARLELLKPRPDFLAVRDAFLSGKISSEDIPGLIALVRRFGSVSYLANAISIWTEGDALTVQLEDAGNTFHKLMMSPRSDSEVAKAEEKRILQEIEQLNERLSPLEEQFSETLGEGSRWLETVVLSLLLIAVLTVESIGLTLTFLTSRSISRGLAELNEAATRIGHGDFRATVAVRSSDEIGTLAAALNKMGSLLSKSYRELEERVQERTAALSKLADENAKLYEEAATALRMREEFLSIASHELRTPLTSLYLQLQLLDRAVHAQAPSEQGEHIAALSDGTLRQTRRLTALLDQLLDLTRLRVGKFEIKREKCDLAAIVHEVASQLGLEAARNGSTITIRAPAPVMGQFDPTRMGQVVTNLLSNAIKYGKGGPIGIEVLIRSGRAMLSVRDQGPGIPEAMREKIFERFERADMEGSASGGLGLGLYITQQIVQAHGGLIAIESEPGKGAQFRVEFPLC